MLGLCTEYCNYPEGADPVPLPEIERLVRRNNRPVRMRFCDPEPIRFPAPPEGWVPAAATGVGLLVVGAAVFFIPSPGVTQFAGGVIFASGVVLLLSNPGGGGPDNRIVA